MKEITGFQRSFQPPHKRVFVSDYNMVNPAGPPRGKKDAMSIYDMMPGRRTRRRSNARASPPP